MSNPFVSVIVPVRNAARTINTTFEYLLAVDYPRDRLEIIFADGGSTDDTVKIIEKYRGKYPFIKVVEIIQCPSPGFARTRALREIKGDFIFFTDGDCAPCKEWIHKMLAVFEKEKDVGAVGGEIFTLRVNKENSVEIYCEAFGFNRVSWRYGNLGAGFYPPQGYLPTEVCGHRSYFFVTANVAYRKKAVDDAGCEFWSLPTGEDIDFGIRARKAGWKFFFLPEASVQHMHRADLPALLRVWRSYGMAHPPLLSAHAKKYMEFVFQFIGQYPQHPSVKIPSLIKGFIFIGNFHLMHLFGALFVLTFILQWIWPFALFLRISAWIFCFLTAVYLFRFFRPSFNIEPYGNWPVFAKIKYMTNLYFILGGLKESVRYKTICVEPSF
ncbi:MAG: glycosyltransferase [Candidatus Omnitrophota bacterium]